MVENAIWVGVRVGDEDCECEVAGTHIVYTARFMASRWRVKQRMLRMVHGILVSIACEVVYGVFTAVAAAAVRQMFVLEMRRRIGYETALEGILVCTTYSS